MYKILKIANDCICYNVILGVDTNLVFANFKTHRSERILKKIPPIPHVGIVFSILCDIGSEIKVLLFIQIDQQHKPPLSFQVTNSASLRCNVMRRNLLKT